MTSLHQLLQIGSLRTFKSVQKRALALTELVVQKTKEIVHSATFGRPDLSEKTLCMNFLENAKTKVRNAASFQQIRYAGLKTHFLHFRFLEIAFGSSL